MSNVSYLGFPLLFAGRRNAALIYSMLCQGSAITSKCVNEYKALEIPTSICLPVCFSFCTLTFSPSVTSLHMDIFARKDISLRSLWSITTNIEPAVLSTSEDPTYLSKAAEAYHGSVRLVPKTQISKLRLAHLDFDGKLNSKPDLFSSIF